ncbi:MAG: putative oxidoreductase iron-sulfur subunit [Firmicutes bacterium]|nr:putative oxidoreductase iron-sulfur subunit [Bacillota bacterium]
MQKGEDNARYGLLIDYEYCTNCHTCEVACKKELGLKPGEYGIKVLEDGPRQNPSGKWEWSYLPVPTSLCNLCEKRVAEGRKPTCVHHCQSGIMYYGPVEELAKKLAEKPKMVLYSK